MNRVIKRNSRFILITSSLFGDQQVVYEIIGLNAGKHSGSIINLGRGKVAVDSLIVQ